ncbi:proline dehydrogenase [Exophiala oligosperma]
MNPDKNPLLRMIVYPLVYKQFCAGRDQAEIARTSAEVRRLGFSGVVLCYGKEVQVQGGTNDEFLGYNRNKVPALDAEVAQWEDGNIETLNMIAEGDWLGIKFTGAGTNITKALMDGDAAPERFVKAMDRICETAMSKGCRIWIDAEQQVLQPAIDRWTFDLMRRYNKPLGRQALVYNTIQAYLKSARDKVQHQLELAQREGWRPAIKLVRGAYIANDVRSKIHDTKDDTDASYNGIVEDLLQGRFPAQANQQPEEIDLLLAGHNTRTIRAAARLATDLAAHRKLQVRPEFAQLQGMADDIGCEIVQMADQVKVHDRAAASSFVPKVYKCLTRGSIQECMQYLTRRLVENRGAGDRMKLSAAEYRHELLRRWGLSWNR